MRRTALALLAGAASLLAGACSSSAEKAPPLTPVDARVAPLTFAVVEESFSAVGLEEKLELAGARVAKSGTADVIVRVFRPVTNAGTIEFMLRADGRLIDEQTIHCRLYYDEGGWRECLGTKIAIAVVTSDKLAEIAKLPNRKPMPVPAVPGQQAAPVPAPAPAPQPSAGVASTAGFIVGSPQRNAYALVVGIERYRDISVAATGARADAERFAALARTTLGIPEDNIKLALDDHAARSDLEKHLVWLKGNVPQDGRVYFFFSGHGAPDASNGTSYLLPYDGDPKMLSTTGIELAAVIKALGETRARDAVAVVDACFSGAGGRSVLPPGARPLVRVKDAAPVARVALFSAASGPEIAGPAADGKGGLFSKYVLEGLGRAQADYDGDGTINLGELADWVKPRVSREAKKDSRDQTPSLVVGSGAAAASLVVASGLGAK
ncbi:MAG: caspase family protein [Deltaproteobacteria bacterium]|nr:caspase family protein [Deltaproteobacteria bacterium]